MTVINLSKRVNNSAFTTPRQMCEEVIKYFDEHPEKEKEFNKAAIILLDNHEENLEVEYFFANLCYTETLILGDLLRRYALENLGY